METEIEKWVRLLPDDPDFLKKRLLVTFDYMTKFEDSIKEVVENQKKLIESLEKKA